MHEEFARDDTPSEAATALDERAEVSSPPPSAEGPPTAEAVFEALKSVFDPELGINVVDLGLVYDVQVADNGDVDIQYTLTTMGCPIGPMIEDQMRSFVRNLPGVGDIRPDMVLRPAWSPEMMSDEAKAALGIF
jgi:metal-sulfur cluster biosynthetic enzyme